MSENRRLVAWTRTLARAGESQLVPRNSPHNPRRFTHRECARLMGFPDWYVLVPGPTDTHPDEIAAKKRKTMENSVATPGDCSPTPDSRADGSGWLNGTYQMIGNAVCPPLVAALAGAVIAHSDIPCSQMGGETDWVSFGRAVAVQLAVSAIDRKQCGGAGVN
jgi:site-specific DNA-cytosine methylase